MKLQDIYDKKIDRPIEGVIKADDATSLRQEVEEYVLTNEVSKRLNEFLDAYNNYNNANGVWISGFFGSGKSHLLKILSLILENKEVGGTKILDLFLPKCQDAILKAELKKAANLKSQSILFNIDQKADVISKTEIDALLSVFVKVFDQECGYYGKQGHIAKFERDLDARNQLTVFKENFAQLAGKPWDDAREQSILESTNITKAYAKTVGAAASEYNDILGKYRSEYRVSIEDFADQVWRYIQSKGKNFRLNFFVDEVGQYIAENIKLMTNLQTIAESLATKCRGQAWLIVTAQEDMNNVVGEMDRQQANDFSKIQARFSNRMKLTSQDVAEVIQKRLLAKKIDAIKILDGLYQKHSNDFKTLFDFADGSQTYRNFRDQEHFVVSYPFIPYQFALFQSAIQNLSIHNAFEGKHSSVGERSMLGVFQQVAVRMISSEIGSLATFDLMFEGIRTALKSQIQRSILNAENNLASPFALKVLKALFLVKYVKEFKPSIRNICILMQDSIDRDLPELKQQVEEALNLLEQQTYIQRNGNLYEFLTDEEKDIEQEIKDTEVDPDSESEELSKIIFDDILKDNKISYEKNGQFYKFARKLDDKLHGSRDHELTIHVISPFYEHAGNLPILRGHNMGRDELMVIMDHDTHLLRDISMFLRTEKYIRQNTKIAQQTSITRILQDKRETNNQRRQDILHSVRRLLADAQLMAQGTDVEAGSSDPQMRIINGFQELITTTYPQLKILRDVPYKEASISNFLNPGDSLFSENATNLDEAEQEVFGFIASQARMGVRTTLKTLSEQFERKPYGWYLAALQCTVAKLNTRGKIECQLDSNVLEGPDLERAIKNTHAHANLVLKPQQEFTATQIRGLKDFYEEFFDVPPAASEAKSLGAETAEALRNKLSSIRVLAAQRQEYPFLTCLDGAIDKLQEVIGKPYSFYVTELSSFGSALLDMRESVIQPIEAFMSGEKKRIYSDAREFLRQHEHDFGYIDGKESIELRSILDAADCFKGDKIRTAKDFHVSLKAKLEKKLQLVRASKSEAVEELKSKITTSEKFKGLGEPIRELLISQFSPIQKKIQSIESIPVLESEFTRFESITYTEILAKLDAQDKPAITAGTVRSQTQIIQASRVRVFYDKPLLGSVIEVEEYVEKYKEALINEINSGKKVQV